MDAYAQTTDYAHNVIHRYEQMKTYRGLFERQWSEIARRVLPRADDFITKRAPGQRREEYVFDSTAQLALPSFAAAMESMLTPRTAKWHNLSPVDPRLALDDGVKRFCESLRDLLFRVRYAPNANFASQAYEHYMGLGAFGTSALFVQDALGKGIRYQSIPLAELFIQEDAAGVVDTVYRKYELTARQAYQKWGEKLPEAIAKCVEKEPERRFEFIHAVRPNEELDRTKKNYKGMAFNSCDVAIEGRMELSRGGYRTMPYAVSRYTTSPREVYGRSPAWDAIADIKTLNEMAKTSLRYGQLVVDPPWVTADVDSLSPFAMRPGSINAGYMTEQGQVLAKSLAPETNPNFTLEMANQRRESINRAFLVTLFQILVDTPQMTATEAMLRAQEKGALLAPTVGRQQSEFLGPLITRELDILQTSGVIGQLPDALRQTGGQLQITYDSPLTRAQKAEEGVGIMRTLEALTPLANIDQSVLGVVNAERTFRRLADINGAPMDMLNTVEEMQAKQQAQQQQMDMQSMMQAAPIAAQTAKTMAEAQATAQQAKF